MDNEEPRKVDTGVPISAIALLQLINNSIESGSILWLVDVNLRGANLYGVNLSRAALRGADLRGAKYNADTKWPLGFDPEAAGAVLMEDHEL